MSDLTLAELKNLFDSIQRVLYVHPDDLADPLVQAFRDAGFGIASRDVMVKGRGFFKNSEKAGIVNFDERTITYGRNPFADLLPSARGGWQ